MLGDDVDDRVGQDGEVRGLPVVVPAMGDGVVDAALMVDVQRGSDQIHERGPELGERTDGALTVLDGSGVAAGNRDGGPEVQVLVDHRQRRQRAQPNDGPELVGRVGDEVPVEAQDIDGVLGRPEDRSGHDGGAEGVQREPERAHDAEVPATAPQRPEQVGVVVGRRPHDVAARGDHLGLHEIVDGEPVLAHEPPGPPPRADAADAGVAHDAARGGQAVCLCLVVDVAPQGTTLDEGRAVDEIDRDGAHRRQVDDDPVVAHRGAGDVVASASYGDLEVAVAGEAHRRGDVGGAAAAGDQPGSPVDRAVPNGSGVFVVMVVGGDEVASEPGDLHGGWCGHRSSSGGWAHRNIGGYRGEVSDLDFAVRNLDFTTVGWCGTLRS